jgi:hypothetical protein
VDIRDREGLDEIFRKVSFAWIFWFSSSGFRGTREHCLHKCFATTWLNFNKKIIILTLKKLN